MNRQNTVAEGREGSNVRCRLWLGSLLLIAVACGGGAQSVDVPAGYSLFDGSERGFLVALPSNWDVADLTTGDIDARVAEIERASAAADSFTTDYFAETAALDTDYVLVAGDFASGDLSMVHCTEKPDWLDLDTLEEGFRASSSASVDRVEVSGIESLRVVDTLGDSVTHKYNMLHEETHCLVSFGGISPDTVDTIMGTFTLID